MDMDTCKACPNRWLAKLSRAVGEENLATEIESAGCPDRWAYVKDDNAVTVCGRTFITQHLNKVGAEAQLASSTAQAARNDDAERWRSLESRLDHLERLIGTLASLLAMETPRPNTLLGRGENGCVAVTGPTTAAGTEG